MKYKVVVDSCGELTEEMKQDPHFASVPLILEVDGESIVDDETFCQADFLKKQPPHPIVPSHPVLLRKATAGRLTATRNIFLP